MSIPVWGEQTVRGDLGRCVAKGKGEGDEKGAWTEEKGGR